MKKLIMACALLGSFTLGNAEASELVDNVRKTAQPTQSKYAYKSFSVKRFVLASDSDSDYYKLINSAAREVGSDNQKLVKIIWNNKIGAERIRSALIKRGVLEDKIKLVQHTKKRPLYPIYVEVESISARPTNCRVVPAEQMVIYREHDPCALENNNRIQKRN